MDRDGRGRIRHGCSTARLAYTRQTPRPGNTCAGFEDHAAASARKHTPKSADGRTMIKDDSALAHSIQQSTGKVFKSMFAMEVNSNGFERKGELQTGNEILSIIGIRGEWKGSFMLVCDPTSACKLVSTMLGADIPELNDEVLDGIGELANIMMGNLKDALEEGGKDVAMTPPHGHSRRQYDCALACQAGMACGSLHDLQFTFRNSDDHQGITSPATSESALLSPQPLLPLISPRTAVQQTPRHSLSCRQ